MDFTSLAILKTAQRDVLDAIDARGGKDSFNLPVRQVEKLKSLVFSRNEEFYAVVVSGCILMKVQQLVKFMLSIDRTSPDALGDFFEYLRVCDSSQGTLLCSKLTYVIHAVYFADVFLDSKVIK